MTCGWIVVVAAEILLRQGLARYRQPTIRKAAKKRSVYIHRSLLQFLTSTTADINVWTPPSMRTYAACTRETTVVAMQVEKMITSRRRRQRSVRVRKSFRGNISKIESATTSAALDLSKDLLKMLHAETHKLFGRWRLGDQVDTEVPFLTSIRNL